MSKQNGKLRRGLIIAVISFIIVSISLTGCSNSKSNEKKQTSGKKTTTTQSIQAVKSLIDYADRLEKAGNEEAAAKVRAAIPQAAAGEARQKAYEQQKENDELQMMEDMEDLLEAYNLTKGGKGK